jgi:hypothetical protein
VWPVETAIRQNGDGAWVNAELTQTIGQHFRADMECRPDPGEPDDFLDNIERTLTHHGRPLQLLAGLRLRVFRHSSDVNPLNPGYFSGPCHPRNLRLNLC